MWKWWTDIPRPIQRVRLWTVVGILVALTLMISANALRPLNALIYATMVLPGLTLLLFGWWETRIVKRASRAAFLICPRCEYSLKEMSENRCPECGTACTPASLRKSWLVHGEPKNPLA